MECQDWNFLQNKKGMGSKEIAVLLSIISQYKLRNSRLNLNFRAKVAKILMVIQKIGNQRAIYTQIKALSLNWDLMEINITIHSFHRQDYPIAITKDHKQIFYQAQLNSEVPNILEINYWVIKIISFIESRI